MRGWLGVFFLQNKTPALWNILHQLQKELQYIFLKWGMSQLHLLGVGVTFQNPTDSHITKLNIIALLVVLTEELSTF